MYKNVKCSACDGDGCDICGGWGGVEKEFCDNSRQDEELRYYILITNTATAFVSTDAESPNEILAEVKRVRPDVEFPKNGRILFPISKKEYAHKQYKEVLGRLNAQMTKLLQDYEEYLQRCEDMPC